MVGNASLPVVTAAIAPWRVGIQMQRCYVVERRVGEVVLAFLGVGA